MFYEKKKGEIMSTKEKIRTLFVCTILSLVAGLFLLCVGENSAQFVFANGIGEGSENSTLSISSLMLKESDKSDISISGNATFTKTYDGNAYQIVATIDYTGAETLECNWYLEKIGEDVPVSRGVVNSLESGTKTSTLTITNVNESGVYYLKAKAGSESKTSSKVGISILKRDVSLQFSTLGYVPTVDSSDGYFEANYIGEDYAGKLAFCFTDVAGKTINVKFYCVTDSSQEQTTNLINAGKYRIYPVNDNYNFSSFVYGKNQEIANFKFLNFKINKVAPQEGEAYIQLKKEFVYTGETQDLKDFFVAKNSGQSINFVNKSTFTTYDEGVELAQQNKFTISGTDNYTEGHFVFTMSKAQPVFDLTDMQKTYTYTGEKIVVTEATVSSGATIRQEAKQENNVVDLLNAGKYTVTLSVDATSDNNYSAGSVDVEITIGKKKINLYEYEWDVPSSMAYKKGNTYTIYLKNVDSVVDINYIQDQDVAYLTNSAQNAGRYLATASATLKDKDNYELVGAIPSCFYTIYKRTIEKPTATNTTFTYNGSEQSLSFTGNSGEYYEVTGEKGTNAGNYVATIKLKDKDNVAWINSDKSEDLTISWTINKKLVKVGEYKTVLIYNGNKQTLKVGENDLYYAIGDSAIDIGNYKTVLVLRDSENYAFDESGASEYTIKWKITGDKQTAGLPIVLIVFVTILVTALAVFLTLRYTVIAKEKKQRRKRLEQKLDKINKENKK